MLFSAMHGHKGWHTLKMSFATLKQSSLCEWSSMILTEARIS